MGKKKKKLKKETNSSAICEYIYGDYIDNVDLKACDRIRSRLQDLVDNRLAYKISGMDATFSTGATMYRIMSKFMQDNNPKLKDNRRVLKEYDFGGSENKYANDDQRIVELAKYSLEDGSYYAQLDDTTYAALYIQFDKEYEYELTYELYIIGKKWKKWKTKFYQEVDKYKEIDKRKKSDVIYYSDGRPSNTNVIFKPFDKIVFTDKQKLLDYIDNFVNNIPTYYSYGMVPKLSIMLKGEPGTGKSTVAKAIAKALGINAVTIYSPSYFDENQNVPDSRNRSRRSTNVVRGIPSVSVLDDVDCVCKSREEDDSKENADILSNLLEFLDTPPAFDYKAKDGVRYPLSIVVASTNYYDKLDYAVKRFGRFDLTIEMKYFNKQEAQEMCDIYDLKLEDVVKNCNDKKFKISPSELQALCLENIDKSLKNTN